MKSELIGKDAQFTVEVTALDLHPLEPAPPSHS